MADTPAETQHARHDSMDLHSAGTPRSSAKDHDQTLILSGKRLILVFFILSTASFASFMEQSAIGLLIPSIGEELAIHNKIGWIGTASLITQTACSNLWGRLSDLLGRKKCLLVTLAIFGVASICAAFAQNFGLIIVSRILSGIANGGISSLVQMMVSDHVSLRDRSRYQGILGAGVGLGAVMGVLVAALLATFYCWRGYYYLQCALIGTVWLICCIWLPGSSPKIGWKEFWSDFDVAGLSSIVGAVVLSLTAVAQTEKDGVYWGSPTTIALLCSGGLCFIAFILFEWKYAELPMMPLHAFKNVSVAAMLAQTFLFGATFQIQNFYLPLYLQNVHGYPLIKAACLQMPSPILQAIAAPLAGILQSKWDRYLGIHFFGFIIWVLGCALLCICSRSTQPVLFCFIVALIGLGVGCILQPTIVALQAHSSKKDRAVIISTRNFLRNSGGACGLAVSSALATNRFQSVLTGELRFKGGTTFAAPEYDLFDDSENISIQHSCTVAIRAVFILSVCLLAVCPFLCALVTDNGLTRPEEKDAGKNEADETPSEGSQLPASPPDGEIESGGPLPPARAHRNMMRSFSVDVRTDDTRDHSGIDLWIVFQMSRSGSRFDWRWW